MSPAFLPRLLLPFLAAALTGLAQPPDPGAERSDRLRRQIEALLGPRRAPVALPVDPPNPFSLAAAGTITPAPAVARAPAPAAAEEASNAATLARLASRLRIGGLIRLRDHMQVVINDNPWREGDVFVVEREPQLIQLQVVRIAPGQLTLRLADAELTLRF